MESRFCDDALASSFDSEVMELIQALDLVQIGSPAWRSWFAVLVESRYTRFWLCERYRNALLQKEREKQIRLSMYQYKNRKNVYGSFSYQPEIVWR